MELKELHPEFKLFLTDFISDTLYMSESLKEKEARENAVRWKGDKTKALGRQTKSWFNVK